ncbi:MAG: DUF4957 domain-containing protein [Bacteroidales bacterium]|nr:DUF4957 domain-containing protein [Bacteroidales bacterium]
MKLKNILMLAGVASLGMGVVACEDRDDEITEAVYARLFSPTGIKASVRNNTNLRVEWTEVAGAESYIIEAYPNDSTCAGTNTPLRIEGITYDKQPYTIEGLEGNTYYSIRLKAVSADASKSSAWNWYAENGKREKTIKTNGEQIVSEVKEEDITPNGAKIFWTAGRDVTNNYFVVTKNGEEVAKFDITSEDNEKGYKELTGLTGESSYKVTLYKSTTDKGEVARGSVNFKTAIDLGGAIPVNPGDNLKAIIASAEDGATLALFPGLYNVLTEDGANAKIVVDKSLKIFSVRSNDRAIINGCIHITNGASFEASKIIFDGGVKADASEEGIVATDGSQAFEWKDAVVYGSFKLDDCEIKRYTKGFYYANQASTIPSVEINNCLIHDIECSGGDLFDCRKAYIKELTLTENTIWNSAAERDMIRYDNNAANVEGAGATTIKVEKNTLYNVGSGKVGYRLLYVRWGNVKDGSMQTISFKNNIVANFLNTRGFSNQATTSSPEFAGNFYFNCVNLQSIAEGNTEVITFVDEKGKAVSADPFAGAADGDFTVKNEDMIYAGTQPGASRWYSAQ